MKIGMGWILKPDEQAQKPEAQKPIVNTDKSVFSPDTTGIIIMSKIISIIIDDIEFKRSDYVNSRVTQNFYNFIKRNSNEITYISYKEHNSDDHMFLMYLKDGKLHSTQSLAFCRVPSDFNFFSGYYINGEKLEYSIWLKKSRKLKLENIQKHIF